MAESEDGIPVDVEVVEELGAEAFAYGAFDLGGKATPVTARLAARG